MAASTWLTDPRGIRELHRNHYATGKERLTSHQREVYGRLVASTGGKGCFVLGSRFGCVGALDRLVLKGRAERALVFGERGGWLYYYRAL